MTETTLTVEHHAGIARVTMNRPAVHNAFDDALIGELTEALLELQRDQRVRAVVLAASGRSFSAGADLNWMRRMAGYDWQENFHDSRGLGRLMHTLYRLECPTIARVNGAAMGGGVGLVACCDIAVASESAVFALSEVKLGLIPAVISPYVVSAMGERQARRYFVTGERFDARRAQRLGLVHEVVAPEALDDAVERLAGALRANGPQAMRAAKALALDTSRGPLDDALIEETAQRIADQRASEEGREGVCAFLDKRRASWVQQ